MSGHSKWATTKRHKALVDAKRGKLFSVISKELTIAAQASGGDPDFNPRLRMLVLKAKAANMPADNVERAIKKGTGELPGVAYQQLIYEGYGPSGVAVLVEVTTDNKNRSASEVRSTFGKRGGKLAGVGALKFVFTRRGQFLIDEQAVDEDRLMELALEADAEDVKNHQDHFELLCEVGKFDKVGEALEQAGVPVASAELAYLPNNTVAIDDEAAAKAVLRLLEGLEDLDDVRAVWCNEVLSSSLEKQLRA